MIQRQKQHDEASQQSQEKYLSEETAMLRREIDDSGMFLKSMVVWTTSEQFDDIRELQNEQRRTGFLRETG